MSAGGTIQDMVSSFDFLTHIIFFLCLFASCLYLYVKAGLFSADEALTLIEYNDRRSSRPCLTYLLIITLLITDCAFA